MKIVPMEVTLIDHMGNDLSVVNAARVSFAKESQPAVWYPGDPHLKLQERDVKLIQYLAKHKHTSPFNHAFMTFRVKAPIFVARQLVKHKFMPWNEVSRRYVNDEPEFYFPDRWRARAENVKQGSSEKEVVDLHSDASNYDDHYSPESVTEFALTAYGKMLSAGVAPEQARMLLPQNTMTEWIWSGTLGAYLDMLKLRLDPHAQQESREVAEQIAKHVRQLFPVSFEAVLSQ